MQDGEFVAELLETFERENKIEPSKLLGPKHLRKKSSRVETRNVKSRLTTKTCIFERGMIIAEEDIAGLKPSDSGHAPHVTYSKTVRCHCKEGTVLAIRIDDLSAKNIKFQEEIWQMISDK